MQMRLDGMQLITVAHVERAQRRTIQMFVSLTMPQLGLFLTVQHDRLGILIHLVEIPAQKENNSFTHCEKNWCLALIERPFLCAQVSKLPLVNNFFCVYCCLLFAFSGEIRICADGLH